MRKKTHLIAAGIIAAVLAAGPAFAGESCETEGKSSGWNKDKMEKQLKDLNLTEDQEKKLKESKESFREQASTLRAQLKEKRQALHGALSKAGVTRQEIEPLVAEMKALQSRMMDQRIEGIFKIKEILTPEQFEKLQAKKAERMKSGKMKRGHKE